MTDETRNYLGGFPLLAGLVLILAYSGAWHESPLKGIVLACCAATLGLVIAKSRLTMLGVCVGVIGIRLLFSTLLHFDMRLLTLSVALLFAAFLIVNKVDRIHRRR